MKKLLVLLILTLVLMTACTPVQTETTQSGVDACLQPENLRVYSTLDGYEEFISAYKLPSNFVHIDKLTVPGRYLGFVTFTDQFPNYYEYTWIDENGKDISLCVTHNIGNNRVTTEKYPQISVTSDMTSLAKAPCKERSVIERNGVIYLYADSGYLMNIIWYENNTEYKWSAHWSSETVQFIRRLVSLDEDIAKEAYSEIKASLVK